MSFVQSSVKFDNNFVVKAKGKADGLTIMWREGISAKLIEFNKNLIAVKFLDAVCDWLFVGFYGPPYYSKKKKAWENFLLCLCLSTAPGFV